jgi:predicted  nucleic acid-binding Zn-ribbon protein
MPAEKSSSKDRINGQPKSYLGGVSMSQVAEGVPVNSYEKELVEMKNDIKTLEKEVSELKSTTIRHDEQISAINRTLESINENTTWIKRTITASIIGALTTGAIGIVITVLTQQ